MVNNKIKMDFDSVKNYANKLKTQSETLKTELSAGIETLKTLEPNLVSNYFTDYSNYINKIEAFGTNLSHEIDKYRINLETIEGYVRQKENLFVKPLTRKDTSEFVSKIIKINVNTVLNSGYGDLSIYVTTPELNTIIKQILKKYNLTLVELFSGNYNPALTDIINHAPNLSVFIMTVTQMEPLSLQMYLKELGVADIKPPLYPSIELYLKYYADNNNVPYEALLIEQKYAPEIKESLIQYKDSLVILNDISLGNPKDIQIELNNLIHGKNEPINDIDNVTKEILKDYLSAVADENKIKLEDMLTLEKYADLSKEALESFVDNLLYGEPTEIPLSKIIEEVELILDKNDVTINDVLDGNANEVLTDIIGNTDDKISADIIGKMDDKALQKYIKEVVENKHPTVIEKPVIKETIKIITDNSEIIINETNFEEPILDGAIEEQIIEKPIIIDDNVKEILSDTKYAPQIKETVRNNNSMGWLVLIPIMGLGAIPLYNVLKNRKEQERDETNYEKDYIPTTIIINEEFSRFALENGSTEEVLLSGGDFEILTMYLSKLDNLKLVLDILTNMKDEHLQTYLKELNDLKYEHIWSQNSIILKVIFNTLSNTSKKQALDFKTLLSDSSYVVWIKSSIIDLSQSYIEFEEDIKFNGGFVTFINNILNKTIEIPEDNFSLLKTYVEVLSKNENLNTNSYLEKLNNDENKLKIFSIIKFGDGTSNHIFGFWKLIEAIETNLDNVDDLGSRMFNERIIETSGYLELLFNSTDEQINKVLEKIFERYNTNKDSIFNGTREEILDALVEKAPNLVVLLYVLLNLDSKKLQTYLNKYKLKPKTKFLTFLFKYLEYLAKSETTSIDFLLTDEEYANLIKDSLSDLKESIMKLYAISKKDDSNLNSEINSIFFMEDSSVIGIDRITINLLRDYLSSYTDKMKMGLNALLDINNVDILRKLLDNLIENLIYLNVFVEQEEFKEKEEIKQGIIKEESNDIVDKIKDIFKSDTNLLIREKLSKYISILGKDINLTLEEYLDSIEFSNFININFKNENLIKLLNALLLKQLNIVFDINDKLKIISENNNLNIEETISEKGTNLIVESIIKENNIIYTLEVLLNLEENSYNKIIKELNIIKQNTNLEEVFVYVEDYLKIPSEISMEEYLENKNNLKNIQMLLSKLLIMLLIIIYLREQEEFKEKEEIKQGIIKEESNDIVDKIKDIFKSDTNLLIREKLSKYISILGKDINLTLEEYLDSIEFSNFININFKNENLIKLLNALLLKQLNIVFDINDKLKIISENNNLNIEETISEKGTNLIVESIIKENNIIYTLEVLLNLEENSYNKIIKELNIIKQNTNLEEVFVYVEDYLKIPSEISMEEYLENKNNLKNIWMFLLKLLIMLLIIIYLKEQEEVL